MKVTKTEKYASLQEGVVIDGTAIIHYNSDISVYIIVDHLVREMSQYTFSSSCTGL